jgi:hypothetical protein
MSGGTDATGERSPASSLVPNSAQAWESRANSGLRLEKLSIEFGINSEENQMKEDISRLQNLVGQLSYSVVAGWDDDDE